MRFRGIPYVFHSKRTHSKVLHSKKTHSKVLRSKKTHSKVWYHTGKRHAGDTPYVCHGHGEDSARARSAAYPRQATSQDHAPTGAQNVFSYLSTKNVFSYARQATSQDHAPTGS